MPNAGALPGCRTAMVAEPDPSWPVQADRLMRRLAAVLGAHARRIDHIGSTSVPGLPAKDIIDLQVVVDDLEAATACAAAGQVAGFVHVAARSTASTGTESVTTSRSRWTPIRDARQTSTFILSRPRSGGRCCCSGTGSAPTGATRDEYASLKRALAGRPGHDVDDYGRDKMPWISQALARAERWARGESGPGPSDRL
ncbi:GrpB family protein [Actinomadura luteofluorescens]|uniref:GrpB family protein n=1 Tax=Actinomadura luteofluorescens TaxID=46163 RepID=UPI0036267994